MLDKNLHKNHSYNTSVLLLTTEQKVMIIAIEAEVLHATTLTTKLIHKIDTVLPLEIDLVTTKVLPLHNTLDHDMILINAIHAPIVLHTDLRIDPLIDTILALITVHRQAFSGHVAETTTRICGIHDTLTEFQSL